MEYMESQHGTHRYLYGIGYMVWHTSSTTWNHSQHGTIKAITRHLYGIGYMIWHTSSTT